MLSGIGNPKPTDEQQAIIEAAREGGHVAIQAGAGTGKTSTLQMVADALPTDALYVAYNRAIADDAAMRFPRHVTCRTAHSLAMREVGKDYRHRLNGPRRTNREIAQMMGLRWLEVTSDIRLSPAQVARIVMDTVRRFCFSADEHLSDFHVPLQPKITGTAHRAMAKAVAPLATKYWNDVIDHNGTLPYTHDFYLKTWALTKPILPVDVIFLDEGQDANPVIAALVENQSHAQQIVVGDACQQLYSWRGASDVLSTWPGARQLYLSQSWRFGEAIAEEANKWLSLLPTSLELTGNPAITSRLAVLETPTAVLCRTNAGAMDMVMAFLDAGEKVAMVGGGTALCQLAEAAKTLMAGQRTGHPELYTFRSWEDVRDYVGTDGSGDDLRAFVNLIETHGPDAIIRATKALTDEFHATTVVSTVHRAKGRQWPTVCVGDDFFGPDDDGHLSSAETMVGYVAVTRAQEVLDRTGLAWIDDYVDRLTSDTTE